ncbi:hypothetical protein [Rubinisphaera margarita]|uniref:hypothetical protein n=1 Tax=Rubinisphaera margarita TaxID=2909586 RepID=UPI001EE96A2F|nr:hypothetical protein [Rubinisphaera margarita]MCG6158209.1 hypothetical protein [Rubinisphaera margarita]
MKESDALRVIDDHLDGQDEFSAEVTSELTEWLHDDPENADRAFQRIMLHVLLSRKLSEQDTHRVAGNGSDIVFIQAPAEKQPSPRWMVLLGMVVLIAAAVSGITTSLVLLLPQHRGLGLDAAKDLEHLSQPPPVRLEHRVSSTVRWTSAAPASRFADWTPDEPWTLASGLVEYRFDGSCQFVLEGPARFARLDSSILSVTEGACAVNWTPDKTRPVWSLRTANATIFIEKRASFVLRTSPETGTVLSVLEGEVRFRQQSERATEDGHSLLAGQSVWVEGGKVIVVESDWVEHRVGRVRSALNASPPRLLEAPLVYEGFDYPETLPTSAEFTHAGISLEHGGWGWAGCWQESGSLASSIDHAPLRWNVPGDRRGIESLSFRDQAGRLLRTSGGQLRTSYGQTSRAGRSIDPDAWPAEFRDSQGVGADGSEVWLSFLAQSYDSEGGNRYAFLRLGDDQTGIRLGRLPGPEKCVWSAEIDRTNGEYIGPYGSEIPADEAVLYVVRIRFQPKAEQVRVWLNPELSTVPEETEAALEFTAPNFRLHEILIEGRYSTDFDEIRIGPTFASVSPYRSE